MSKRNRARGQEAKAIVCGSRFSEHRLTSRAGLIMVARFARKLGLGKIIDEMVHLERGANARYPLGKIVTGIALGIISGCRHISHLAELTADEAFMKTQGWKSFPVVSAITRVFERFRMVNCVELAEAQCRLRQKVWNKKWFGVVHLDLDSSAKSAYGHQQGVARGHNTERSHKPMLNPLFAFIAQTGECPNCWLRPGNTHSANGSAEFLKETLAQLPKRVWKVIVRADSAFFSIEFLRKLRRECCGYVVKVKILGWKVLCAGLDWQKARGLGYVRLKAAKTMSNEESILLNNLLSANDSLPSTSDSTRVPKTNVKSRFKNCHLFIQYLFGLDFPKEHLSVGILVNLIPFGDFLDQPGGGLHREMIAGIALLRLTDMEVVGLSFPVGVFDAHAGFFRIDPRSLCLRHRKLHHIVT